MNVVLEVKVLSKGDHPERSEPQLRKGDQPWEGSGERNRGPMNKNRIGGGAERGERARIRKATMVKPQAAQIRRSCGEGRRSYLGRSRLVPERATTRKRRSEKSAEAVVVALPPEAKRMAPGHEGPNTEEATAPKSRKSTVTDASENGGSSARIG
jgi:hypothetical protein